MSKTRVNWFKLHEARRWCAAAHGTQGYGNTVADDGGMDGYHRYSYHLDATEGVAVRFGFRLCIGVRIGCQMHDVFEDTCKTCRDARNAGFRSYEVGLSWACTDGDGETRHERKLEAYRKIRQTPDAVIVKLADRIANVEHAVQVGYTRKVELYRGEMAEFEQQLADALLSKRRYRRRVRKMWAYLDYLLSDDARELWGTKQCCPQPSEQA